MIEEIRNYYLELDDSLAIDDIDVQNIDVQNMTPSAWFMLRQLGLGVEELLQKIEDYK